MIPVEISHIKNQYFQHFVAEQTNVRSFASHNTCAEYASYQRNKTHDYKIRFASRLYMLLQVLFY